MISLFPLFLCGAYWLSCASALSVPLSILDPYNTVRFLINHDGQYPTGTVGSGRRLLNVDSDYIGQIILFAGHVLPEGYFECDGAMYSRNQYMDLYTLLGGAFGESGDGLYFAVPDFRARSPVGAGLSPTVFPGPNYELKRGNMGGTNARAVMWIADPGAHAAESNAVGAGDEIDVHVHDVHGAHGASRATTTTTTTTDSMYDLVMNLNGSVSAELKLVLCLVLVLNVVLTCAVVQCCAMFHSGGGGGGRSAFRKGDRYGRKNEKYRVVMHDSIATTDESSAADIDTLM